MIINLNLDLDSIKVLLMALLMINLKLINPMILAKEILLWTHSQVDSLQLVIIILNTNDIIDSAGSQSVGRRTRCSDRFVKYPYPKTMNSNYQKEFHSKNNQSFVIP